MERDVQYCTTEDGVRIAYCVTGSGPPLLACPLLIESFVLDHMVPRFELFMSALGRNARLIRFDMRGTGLSDRDVADLSIDALVRDIDAVITAVGINSVDVWAPIGSVMRAIAYVVHRPERVRRLVLHEAHASGADWLTRELVGGLAPLARADWRSAAHAIAGSANRARENASDVFVVGEWNRKSTSGETFARFLDATHQASVVNLLHLVNVPTLVLHSERDRLVRAEVAQQVAARIVGSRMRVLAGSSVFFASEDVIRDTTEAIDGFCIRATTAHSRRTPHPPFAPCCSQTWWATQR